MAEPRIVQYSTGNPLDFYLTLGSDHASPAVGVTPSVVALSKAGGAFAAPAGAVAESGNGWYRTAGNSTDTNAAGPLWVHAEGPGCDPSDRRLEVVGALGLAPITLNSAGYPLTFLMVRASDRLTGMTGLNPTVVIRKPGGSFAAPAGAVYEIGYGVYGVRGHAADTNTPGLIELHATATGALPTDDSYFVTGLVPSGGGGGSGPGGNATDALTQGLLAVRALLINSGLFAANTCLVSLDDEPWPTVSPPACVVAPGPFAADEGYVDGGGRYTFVAGVPITVRVILRRTQDVSGQDYLLLTQPNRGGLPAVFAVINALAEQFLFDPSGALISTEGLKLEGVGKAERYGKDKSLCAVSVTWRARLQLGLTVP